MSGDPILLAGYAIPFSIPTLLDSGYERIAPRAFDAALHEPTPFDVRWGGHGDDAPQIATSAAGTAGLFADGFGLAFWAYLDRGDAAILNDLTRRVAPADRCSLSMRILAQVEGEHCGRPLSTVTRATLDHVAVAIDSPAYPQTGVWVAGQTEAASWRIRDMADRWAAGAAAWNARLAATRPAAAPRPAAAMQARPAWLGTPISPMAYRALRHAPAALAGRVIGIDPRHFAARTP